MTFICNLCNKNYSSYQSLWEHKKNIHDIKKIKSDSCKYCNKKLFNTQSIKRHELICKLNPDNIKYKLVKKSDDNTIINENNNNSHNTTNNTTNNNTTNNNTINNTNNGTIVNNYFTIAGEINHSLLSDKDITNILDSGIHSVIDLISTYNFNKKYPQNHTFCTSAINNRYLNNINHKTNEIEYTNKKDFFDKLLINSIETIRLLHNKHILKHPEQKKIYQEQMERIDTFFNDSKRRILNERNFYKRANQLSYNNHIMVKKTWEDLKNGKLLLEEKPEEINNDNIFMELPDGENADDESDTESYKRYKLFNSSEEEEFMNPKKRKSKKVKKEDSSTDESDESSTDEPVNKPKPKILSHKLVKTSSDESDSSDKPRYKKPVIQSSDESSSDDEDIKIVYKKVEYICDNNKLYTIKNNTKDKLVGNYVNGKVKMI